MSKTREEQAHDRLFKGRPLASVPKTSLIPLLFQREEWVRPHLELPTVAKVLTVSDKSGSRIGQSTWWKRSDGWTCIGAQRCLTWMLNISLKRIHRELQERGLKFKWTHAPTTFANP